MQKQIKQIRDLQIIEKELSTSSLGILALYEDDKVVQLPTTFLYRDKNIYIFLDEESDVYQSIHFESHASFALMKNEKIRKSGKNDIYHAFTITMSGSLKRIDEQKLIDEVKESYALKYSKEGEKGNPDTIVGKPVLIDTEEIQAIEESGV